MSRKIIITHGDRDYEGEIGTIASTTLGYESHGILTAYLQFSIGTNGGISVGGYSLDMSAEGYLREGTAFGLDHIIQIMGTVGVDKWEDLKGKQAIIVYEGSAGWGGRSIGIASTTDDSKVLIFKEHAQMWKERAQ